MEVLLIYAGIYFGILFAAGWALHEKVKKIYDRHKLRTIFIWCYISAILLIPAGIAMGYLTPQSSGMFFRDLGRILVGFTITAFAPGWAITVGIVHYNRRKQ